MSPILSPGEPTMRHRPKRLRDGKGKSRRRQRIQHWRDVKRAQYAALVATIGPIITYRQWCHPRNLRDLKASHASPRP